MSNQWLNMIGVVIWGLFGDLLYYLFDRHIEYLLAYLSAGLMTMLWLVFDEVRKIKE